MNTSLEVKEDGQIWLWPDRPVEPRDMIPEEEFTPYVSSYASPYLKQYEKELASAERYLVSNQEVARELLFLKHCIFPKEIALKEVAGIYSIPGLQWELEHRELGKVTLEEPASHTGTFWVTWKGGRTNAYLDDIVAILKESTPSTEQENQDELVQVYSTPDGKLYIKPEELFALKKVQDLILKISEKRFET